MLNPFSPHDTTSWQTLHSAIITSQDGQPLAALVMEYSDSDPNTNRTTHNVFRAGALTLFAPLVKRDWAGQKTGLTVQNVGENLATDVTIRYYNRNGKLVRTLGPDYSDTNPPGCLSSLPAGFHCVVYNPPDLDDPDDPGDRFLGSAVVSSSSQPIVGMVHEAGNNRFMTHVMALADNCMTRMAVGGGLSARDFSAPMQGSPPGRILMASRKLLRWRRLRASPSWPS